MVNRIPCISCGRTSYANSLGGPNVCPACDCGSWPWGVRASDKVVHEPVGLRFADLVAGNYLGRSAAGLRALRLRWDRDRVLGVTPEQSAGRDAFERVAARIPRYAWRLRLYGTCFVRAFIVGDRLHVEAAV